MMIGAKILVNIGVSTIVQYMYRYFILFYFLNKWSICTGITPEYLIRNHCGHEDVRTFMIREFSTKCLQITAVNGWLGNLLFGTCGHGKCEWGSIISSQKKYNTVPTSSFLLKTHLLHDKLKKENHKYIKH